MPESVHKVELLTGSTPGEAADVTPSGRPRRLIVFLLTFVTCLAAGLFYNFQRPAVYLSSASLLTVAPPDIDQVDVPEADAQHVAIQRQRLLSKPLLEAVIDKLEQEGTEAQSLSLYELQPMLDVVQVPETNLVAMQARGEDPEFLPRLVNAWVEVYLDERADEVRQVTLDTEEALSEEQRRIGEQIERKREELDAFRENNEILSAGRDENEAVARLKGLTDSLNTASEEEVKAKARLDAVNAAVRRGDTVVPDQDKRSLAQMERRAQELREQLADLDKRYTREFMNRSPTLKVIPEQLAELERKIRLANDRGRDFVMTEAEQEYAAAQLARQQLAKQLEEHKEQVALFTAKFAQYEALQEDLSGLEELYRDVGERLVQVQAKNRERFPPLKVVEWAFRPGKPISPHYVRDAGIALVGSLLVALFLVWLAEFLSPRRQAFSPVRPIGVSIYPGQQSPAIDHQPVVAPLGARSASPALMNLQSRELTESELSSLFEAADSEAKKLILLLLSGVKPAEVLDIRRGDIDIDGGRIDIGGDSPRTIHLPSALLALFGDEDEPFSKWRDEGGALDVDELDAKLKLLALDAGLQDGELINAALLRHTYVVYLVRQGVKLSEIDRIVGKMQTNELLSYSAYSPTDRGKPLDAIDTVHPVFLT